MAFTTKRALRILLPAIAISAAAQTFPTGEPEMASMGGIVFPMDSTAYRKFAENAANKPNIRVVIKLPASLGPEYRFGYNFVVGKQNRGWILDRDPDGYLLFLDHNGDGDLSQTAPVRLRVASGRPRADIPVVDGDLRWTCRFQVEQRRAKLDAPEQTVVEIIDGAVRRGVVEVAGRKIAFALSGPRARYDQVGASISFDRDGTGKLEAYQPSDQWVNLAGKTYAFNVDPSGASLTLEETEGRPDRPSLDVGSRMPDIVLADLQGRQHRFRVNAAAVTLIEFWATSCGPCRDEMPALQILYERLPRDRFDILGVSSDVSLETLHRFLDEFRVPWAECREPDAGPTHEILRVEGIPAYFLVAKDGEILDRWVGSGSSVQRIEALLAR
jgi:thiol-disulfide isomerase/thioredoxin